MSTSDSIEIAVALHWDGGGAPRVTAKGRGELAQRIKATADAHGVPIDEDPQLVEMLARVELGREIPAQLFTAVAEVIAFAYALNDRLPTHLLRNRTR